MDNNKLKVLRELGYEIKSTCGSCEAGQFSTQTAEFGTCALHTYKHGKHTGPDRELSIHRMGACASYERSQRSYGPLGLWAPFCEDNIKVDLAEVLDLIEDEQYLAAEDRLDEVIAKVGDANPQVHRVQVRLAIARETPEGYELRELDDEE